MNTTTIHFVQDTCHQISTTGQSTYSWPSADHMAIQQLHYVDSNLFACNAAGSSAEKSMSLVQMSNLEPIGSLSQTVTQSISTTQSISAMANPLPSEDGQMTYLTPLINVTLGEPVKPNQKLLPISLEAAINSADYNQQVTASYYDHQTNSQAGLLSNPVLPSMAASFGSPIVTQTTCNGEMNCDNLTSLASATGNLTSTVTCSVTNSLNNRVTTILNAAHHPNGKLGPTGHLNGLTSNPLKSVKTSKLNAKESWTTCSKPGRRPNKLTEQKLKYSNDQFNLNNLSKTIKRVRQRKRLPMNLLAKNAINLSNAPNNLCNLNVTYSPSLNHSNSSIDSSNSLNSTSASLNSSGTVVGSMSTCGSMVRPSKGLGSRPRKVKQPQNTLEQPESVRKRNYRERMRVTQLNDGFQKLKEKIPVLFAGKKMSKVQTLRTAVRYIRALQKSLRGETDQIIGQLVNSQSNGSHQSNNLLNANRHLNQLKSQTTKSAPLNKLPKIQISIEPNPQQLMQPVAYYDVY